MAKKSGTWLAVLLGIGSAVAAGVAASIAITKKHQKEDAAAEAEFTDTADSTEPAEPVQKISGEDRNYVSIPHPEVSEDGEDLPGEEKEIAPTECEDAPVEDATSEEKPVTKEELE